VNPKLLELIKEDPRYMYEAYEFICDTVTFTQGQLGRKPRDGQQEPAENHHVSGSELARGACDLAIREFGLMASTVFKMWGVNASDDIGEIVFNLIELELLSKSDRDNREDFHDLFDLHQTLTDGYTLTTAAYPARKAER
jgi:uncharacterized repeat protein (TIGR04138 family)